MKEFKPNPSLLTREDFEDMLDIMNQVSDESALSYRLQNINDNERSYEEYDGKHYMIFKRQWHLYNPKTGRTTPCNEPEWVKELIEKNPIRYYYQEFNIR